MFRSRIAGGAGAVALVLAAALLPAPWGGTGPGIEDVRTPGEVPGDPVRGAELFRKYDCVRCHAGRWVRHGVNIPPPLAEAGSRSPASWMARYLRDPEPVRYRSEGERPDLRMPALPSGAGPEEARDLAAFLSGLRAPGKIPPLPEAAGWVNDAGLVAEGEELFRQYQCLGCHELGGEGKRVGPSLDGVGERRTPGYIAAMLRDPRAVVPGTAMEDKDLWDEEIKALTAFLLHSR